MELFKAFDNNIPHILFYGNVSDHILTYIENYYPKNTTYILKLYCATSKGIKNIRDDIKLFSKQQLPPSISFKSIILFDAEYLTVDAQYSLRRSIEIYSHSTRYFIITHNKDKLLQPIRSRFIQIYLPEHKEPVKTYIPYSTIKRIMLKDISVGNVVEELYSSGVYASQLYVWLKNKIKLYDDSFMKTLKNERLCLFYLVCLFRNNKEI